MRTAKTSAARRVVAGREYTFDPVMMDRIDPPKGAHIDPGTRVRVVNPHGCPKANAMRMCYIETLAGEFVGLVMTNSLR
ncbi:MAG: hypothetical protein ACYDAG_02520 [Chloroflexota bacterium]